MTKERRLAIRMWRKIKNELSAGRMDKMQDMPMFKINFCQSNGLKWKSQCWFCHYIQDCKKCPISELDRSGNIGCFSSNAPYKMVCNKKLDLNSRLGAADEIIKALEGRYWV